MTLRRRRVAPAHSMTQHEVIEGDSLADLRDAIGGGYTIESQIAAAERLARVVLKETGVGDQSERTLQKDAQGRIVGVSWSSPKHRAAPETIGWYAAAILESVALYRHAKTISDAGNAALACYQIGWLHAVLVLKLGVERQALAGRKSIEGSRDRNQRASAAAKRRHAAWTERAIEYLQAHPKASRSAISEWIAKDYESRLAKEESRSPYGAAAIRKALSGSLKKVGKPGRNPK